MSDHVLFSIICFLFRKETIILNFVFVFTVDAKAASVIISTITMTTMSAMTTVAGSYSASTAYVDTGCPLLISFSESPILHPPVHILQLPHPSIGFLILLIRSLEITAKTAPSGHKYRQKKRSMKKFAKIIITSSRMYFRLFRSLSALPVIFMRVFSPDTLRDNLRKYQPFEPPKVPIEQMNPQKNLPRIIVTGKTARITRS